MQAQDTFGAIAIGTTGRRASTCAVHGTGVPRTSPPAHVCICVANAETRACERMDENEIKNMFRRAPILRRPPHGELLGRQDRALVGRALREAFAHTQGTHPVMSTFEASYCPTMATSSSPPRTTRPRVSHPERLCCCHLQRRSPCRHRIRRQYRAPVGSWSELIAQRRRQHRAAGCNFAASGSATVQLAPPHVAPLLHS